MEDHLGYPKHSVKGYNTGNSRNGIRKRKLRTSAGDQVIDVQRDRNGTYKPQLLKNYATSSNEIEDKVVTMYAKGMTVSDIQSTLSDLYGVDISDSLISQMTNKVLPLVDD